MYGLSLGFILGNLNFPGVNSSINIEISLELERCFNFNFILSGNIGFGNLNFCFILIKFYFEFVSYKLIFFLFLFYILSHIEYYTIPLNINYYWNIGFILSLIIIIQILSGLLLSTLYCNYIIYSYYSIYYIIREILYGFIFRYIHSNGSSIIFGLIFIHYYRSIIFGSIIYIPLSFISGIIILLLFIIIGFIGYILPYGQMSFWGATVITSLLSIIPFLIEWVNGNYYISESSIKRLFILHYLLSFILLLFIFYHIFYLHYQLSNNPIGIINYILFPFFPYLITKDYFGYLIIIGIIIIISFISIIRLSHPDNGLTVNGFLTPLHIIPEWYFLSFYTIIKSIPNKLSGIILLFYSFLFYSLLLECIKDIYSISISIFIIYHYYGISIIYLFIFYSFILLLWIGAMLPQVLFMNYGRIFIIYYLLFTLVLLDYKKKKH